MTFKQMNSKRTGERGNVLFLILIAVALFAALSYAVTQSTRSGGGDAGGETSLIGSAQITQYPASVRTSLVRMIIGGMDPALLEFNAPIDFENCTVDGAGRRSRCVFHPDGGGATYVTSPPDVMSSGSLGSWSMNGDNEINLIGTTAAAEDAITATPSAADIIAFLDGISSTICQKINEELGISGVPVDTGITFSSANMVNNDGSTDSLLAQAGGGTIGGTTTGTSPELDGQPFGCFSDGGTPPSYTYYHVLIER